MPTLADLESKYFPVDPTVTPHSQDTEVFAHIDGVAYFDALATAIKATTGAGDVIYIVNWVFEADMVPAKPSALDPTPATIKKLLEDKVVAGVDVKIVLWTGRNQWPEKITAPDDMLHFTPDVYKGIVDQNFQVSQDFRDFQAGTAKPFTLRVLRDWSGSALDASRHQKYAIVYNKVRQQMRAFVGGIDMATSRLTTPDHPDAAHNWHDAGVELVGGAARAVWTDFKLRWDEVATLKALTYISARSRVKPPVNPPSVPLVAGPASAVIAPTPPTTKSVRIVRSYGEKKDSIDDIAWNAPSLVGGVQQVLAVYTKAINSAARYIYVEDQGLSSSYAERHHTRLYPLVGNAAKRGVKVLFVTSGTADYAYPVDLYHELGLSEDELNFKICRVNEVYVHSKVVLIDDEFAAVGSANFWDRSMDGTDTELTAVTVDTGSFVRDLRVRLMAEHFRVDLNDAAHRSALENVDAAFSLFGMGTAYPANFSRPNSRLYQLRATVPSSKI